MRGACRTLRFVALIDCIPNFCFYSGNICAWGCKVQRNVSAWDLERPRGGVSRHYQSLSTPTPLDVRADLGRTQGAAPREGAALL